MTKMRLNTGGIVTGDHSDNLSNKHFDVNYVVHGVLYINGLTEFGDVGEGDGVSVDKTLNQQLANFHIFTK